MAENELSVEQRAFLVREQIKSWSDGLNRRIGHLSEIEDPTNEKVARIELYKGDVETLGNIEKLLDYVLGDQKGDFLFHLPSGDGSSLGRRSAEMQADPWWKDFKNRVEGKQALSSAAEGNIDTGGGIEFNNPK